MDTSLIYEFIGKSVSVIAPMVALLWAIERWWKRDEHFPCINFHIDATIIDNSNGKIILDVVATLENKGVVPLKISKFICELRGLRADDPLTLGGENIRYQLDFNNLIIEAPFFPVDWDCSFVYPSVKTEYRYLTVLSAEYKYLLLKGQFHYERKNESHHAGKVIKIP